MDILCLTATNIITRTPAKSTRLPLYNHDILLKKLKLYGLDQKSRNWMKSFLMNRSQIVKINETLSEKKSLKWGLPQGSCLSPLIYSVYIADIDLHFPDNLLGGYADDYNVTISDKDPDIIIKKSEGKNTRLNQYYNKKISSQIKKR